MFKNIKEWFERHSSRQTPPAVEYPSRATIPRESSGNKLGAAGDRGTQASGSPPEQLGKNPSFTPKANPKTHYVTPLSDEDLDPLDDSGSVEIKDKP